MDLASIAGVDWGQFTYQPLYGQAAPWKDIPGETIRDLYSKPQGDLNDIPGI